MQIPPNYQITADIIELLVKIDGLKQFINSIEIPVNLKQKIQRVSVLKSSVFSARIEGNPLNLADFDKAGETIKKKEINNLLETASYIEKHSFSKISKKMILALHKKVMRDISGETGSFRKEMGAIFNEAGIAVYISPPPEKINIYIDRLLKYINSRKEKFPLISAFISHLVFEKIHPFLDGNGRTGRLLIALIMKIKSYDFGLIIPFEEYLDEHKGEYYYSLDRAMKYPEQYLIFMLRAFYSQAEKVKELITGGLKEKQTIYLPPRQEEILNIIKDHRLISFDSLRRRFLKVPERTIRYDLKKLIDAGIIIKIGRTKGSYYRIKE